MKNLQSTLGGYKNNSKLTTDDELLIAYMVNTSEYCLKTIRELEQAMKRDAESDFKDKINFYPAEDAFKEYLFLKNSLIGVCITLITSGIQAKYEPHLLAF